VFLLTGCTDADYEKGLGYFGLNEVGPAPQEAPPHYAGEIISAPQRQIVEGKNPFCESAAKQDATANAFDQATKQRIFTRSYRQCVTMFGGISQ
jgi:hypothetical protein